MNKISFHKENKIEDQVIEKIKNDNLHMQSKKHFVIFGVVSVVAIILAVLLASYFISVLSLFFRLQVAQGPAYGIQRNLNALIQAFPWQALILGVIFIVAAIYLISKSGKMYKIRLRYTVPVIVAIIVLIGLLLSFISLPNTGNRNMNGGGPSFRGYHYIKK